MGKTRLVQEFHRLLSTRHDPKDYWPDAFALRRQQPSCRARSARPARAVALRVLRARRPADAVPVVGLPVGRPVARNAARSDMAAHRATLEAHLVPCSLCAPRVARPPRRARCGQGPGWRARQEGAIRRREGDPWLGHRRHRGRLASRSVGRGHQGYGPCASRRAARRAGASQRVASRRSAAPRRHPRTHARRTCGGPCPRRVTHALADGALLRRRAVCGRGRRRRRVPVPDFAVGARPLGGLAAVAGADALGR
jgi:hypothetical protein